MTIFRTYDDWKLASPDDERTDDQPFGECDIPNIAGHKASRKAHKTMRQCIPQWVGYPDRCESEPRP